MDINNSKVNVDIFDIEHFASFRHFACNIGIGDCIAKREFNDNFLNNSIAEEHSAICRDIVDSTFYFIEVFYIDILDLNFHIVDHMYWDIFDKDVWNIIFLSFNYIHFNIYISFGIAEASLGNHHYTPIIFTIIILLYPYNIISTCPISQHHHHHRLFH